MSTRGESKRYLPALDGIRAVAIAAVFAFHLGFGHTGGGYLGVDMFFVLSGFLITGLLVGERQAAGQIHLAAFWGRRARRLLPAVLLLLVVLAAFSWAGGPGTNPQSLRGDSIATLFYVANWHFIVSQQPYFAQFTRASPLLHTWSLAIEEQFYLIWPLILSALLGAAGRGRHSVGQASPRWRLRLALGVTLVLAAGSAAVMALLFHGAATDYRVYYGTDARAFDILIGAALALFLAPRGEHPRGVRVALHVAGSLSFAALIAWVIAGSADTLNQAWMYQGGFLAIALLTAVVIADVSQPRYGALGAVLSIRPVRWVGKISYGLYLWHWPVIQLVTQDSTGLSGLALQATQIGITFGIATLSYYLIELPIRRHRFAGWRRWAIAPIGVGTTAAIIVAGTVPVAEASSASARPSLAAASRPLSSSRASSGQTSAATDVQSSSGAGPAPITLPPGRVPSSSDPLRVDIIGDSVMDDNEPAVVAALESTGVVRVVGKYAYGGFGLTSTPGWRTSFTQMVGQDHPELVMGTWSWDTSAAASDPVGYAGLVNQALSLLLTPGDGVSGVVFFEFPKTGPNTADIDPAKRIATAENNETGREAWNAVVSGLAQLWPGRVMFLPVASSLEVNGHYSTWLPAPGGKWVRARKLDGAHMCPLGAADYAAAILAQLTPVLHLPASQGTWWDGTWTKDPRYNDPVGACPDDQPPPGYTAELAPGAPPTTQFS